MEERQHHSLHVMRDAMADVTPLELRTGFQGPNLVAPCANKVQITFAPALGVILRDSANVRLRHVTQTLALL
jgi:hypothetical protein